MRIYKFVLVIVFVLSCAKEEKKACDFDPEICSAIEILKLNRDNWTSLNIDSYTMDLNIVCFCVFQEPYSITVINNSVASISGNEDWGYEGLPVTINSLFKEIEERIYENPFYFNIKYDEEFGFPKSSSFDMVEIIADEEISYIISNFNKN